jgi:hypothetical protein
MQLPVAVWLSCHDVMFLACVLLLLLCDCESEAGGENKKWLWGVPVNSKNLLL